MRIIAVGLDYEKVTKFLESAEGVKGMQMLGDESTIENKEGAKHFVQSFINLLHHEDVKTDKALVQLILNHL